MNSIIGFLSNPAWVGVQGLLAILAIILSLDKPLAWIKAHSSSQWVTKIPWVLIFGVLGIFTGGMILIYKNLYQGLSILFATTTLGGGIFWLKSRAAEQAARISLQETILNSNGLLREFKNLLHLVKSEIEMNDWKITHTIDDEGNDLLIEEFTLMPVNEPAYFHPMRYSIPDSGKEIIVKAENLSDRTPLSVIEIEETNKYIEYAILLGAPSLVTNPARIRITCQRKAIWRELIESDRDEGFFKTNQKSNMITFEIIAPAGKNLGSFRYFPQVGEAHIDYGATPQRIEWKIPNPPIKKYSYSIFLKK